MTMEDTVESIQNGVVHIDDTDFILSILWLRTNPNGEYFVWKGMNLRNLYRFYQKKHRGECGNLDCDGYPPPADLSSGWTAVSGLCAEQRIC